VLLLRAGASLPDGGVVSKTWLRRAGCPFNGGDLIIPLSGLIYHPKRLREARWKGIWPGRGANPYV